MSVFLYMVETVQTFDEYPRDVGDSGFENFHGGAVHSGGEELLGVLIVPVQRLSLHVQL